MPVHHRKRDDSGVRTPWGRVSFEGRAHDCRFAGDVVELLDRPAYLDGAAVVRPAPLRKVRMLAPVVPTKIIAVGLNYRAHAEETSHRVHDEPVLFLKPPSALIGHRDTIKLPTATNRIDHEAELAVVVGRGCRGITPEDARSVIAGYACANDVTDRVIQQRDGQWMRAKGFDTFCPLGPWVVPEAPPADASIVAEVDGIVVQDGVISDMLVPVPDLVAFISSVMTIEAGDVILTGTPAGIGPIKAGQTVIVRIDGVGELVNTVA